jgi:hypothetical protein
VSQKRYRRFFGNKVQVRVKRRGKSSPLAKQFARHEKPHAVQDKTEEGQPARLIPGYRRITANESSSDSRRNQGEINDHRGRHGDRTEFGLSPSKYEGRFRKRRRPSLFATRWIARANPDDQSQATEGLRFDFLRRSGRTFSTNASAVMPCFLRRIGTAPCSMN